MAPALTHKPTARRRLSAVQLIALCVFAVNGIDCGPGEQQYGPASDDEAMAAIVNTWSAEVQGETLTLSLCEDLSVSEQVEGGNECQLDHVVRGDGKGEAETVDHSGVGCGGCPFPVVAYVDATLSLPGQAEPLPLVGEVAIGSYGDDDPYALPYDFFLHSSDDQIQVDGTIEEDGSVTIRSWDVISAAGPAAMSRTGVASCQ